MAAQELPYNPVKYIWRFYVGGVTDTRNADAARIRKKIKHCFRALRHDDGIGVARRFQNRVLFANFDNTSAIHDLDAARDAIHDR